MSDIVNIEGEFLHADLTELSENDGWKEFQYRICSKNIL